MTDFEKELKARRENINQMISMHSKKRDELLFRARICDIICVFTSIFICGVSFFNYADYVWGETMRILITFFSIILLAGSLLNSFSRYKVEANGHSQAANRFARIKKEIDAMLSCIDHETDMCQKLRHIDEEIASIAEISVISEKDFTRLKHYHRRKEMYRQMISEYDSDSYLIARLKMWRRMRKDKNKDSEEGE